MGLRNYLIPDEHGNNNGRYALSSLYYDSPNLRCYWEKENGIKFRRKLRLRRYETGEVLTEETPIFLEIKQRVDRVTQKRRAILPYGDALRLCNDRQPPDCAPEDKAVIEEIFVFLWQYNLRPMSIVRYDRQAFMGTEYDMGLRVIFDTSLSFLTHPLHLHERPSSLPMLSPNLAIMEIKVNERIPTWLTEMIAAHDLQIFRVSKYCRSIEAAQNMPIVPWRQPMAESAQDVLSSSFSIFNTLRQKIGIKKQKYRAFLKYTHSSELISADSVHSGMLTELTYSIGMKHADQVQEFLSEIQKVSGNNKVTLLAGYNGTDL